MKFKLFLSFFVLSCFNLCFCQSGVEISRSEDQTDFWFNKRYQNPNTLFGQLYFSNNQIYRQPTNSNYRENPYSSSNGYYMSNGYGVGQYYQEPGIINSFNGFGYPNRNSGYGRPNYGSYNTYYYDQNVSGEDSSQSNECDDKDYKETPENTNINSNNNNEKNTQTQYDSNTENARGTSDEIMSVQHQNSFPEVTSETAPTVSFEVVPEIPKEDLKPITPVTQKPAELTPVINANPEVQPVFNAKPEHQPVFNTNPELQPVINTNPELQPVFNTNPEIQPVFNTNAELKPVMNANPELQPVFNTYPETTEVKYSVGDQTSTEGIESPTGFDRRFNVPAAFDSFTSNPIKQITPLQRIDGQTIFKTFDAPCYTPDGNQGQCLTFQNCGTYVSLLKSSPSNAQVRSLLRQAHCGFDGNSPKVCCPNTNGIPNTPPPFTTTTTTPAPTTTLAPVTTVGPIFEPTNGQVLPEPPVCGFSNATLGRVVGGVPAKLGDFPWMALLGYKGKGEPRWLCGGSLITSKHVLTAAHCIHGHENTLYTVRLGELDLASEDEGATPIDVPVKARIKHEEYNAKAFTSDIGILVLEYDVQFTDLITPVCLPMDSELRARSFENFRPIIAGWGDTQYRGESATHLQVLQLPVVSNESCVKAYARYKAQVIDDRVLCAGFLQGGKDACQGDSGGPLFQPIWNKSTFKTYFYQIGVVSFGRKCAEPGFPGVYTRVTHFVPWIEKTVRQNS